MRASTSSWEENNQGHQNGDQSGPNASASDDIRAAPAQQVEWRNAIRARMTTMKIDSGHVITTRKRFLNDTVELVSPEKPCDTCERNHLLCLLSPPHIKCFSCTLKGETCSFGTVRTSQKRQAQREREQAQLQQHQQYMDTWRDLMERIMTTARDAGADDVANMVEHRLDGCMKQMANELETMRVDAQRHGPRTS
ncbi:hypothetical protein OC842_006424 [Tilletia horrida]|uniref:Uncharacterized protein n=1 Tax=Tilletia horrida TaxID=155126 RepID=A0AAN6G7A5_9BASI|nr:hypothetical protein OC842_006424 [Tilletia horrida]